MLYERQWYSILYVLKKPQLLQNATAVRNMRSWKLLALSWNDSWKTVGVRGFICFVQLQGALASLAGANGAVPNLVLRNSTNEL